MENQFTPDYKDWGLIISNNIETGACLQMKAIGEPYTGNLYVRFDEGGGLNPRLYSNVYF